jgi:uncharacterized Ntn-hydrolase superfamily protein
MRSERARTIAGGLGIEHHTFTIVARCERSGAIGICLTSSPMSVAARCAWVRGGCGIVATQAYANPALGPLGLSLLERGEAPDAVLSQLRASDPWREYRQVAVLDTRGRVAVYTGDENKDWRGHIDRDNVVVMGNFLTGPQVVEAMRVAFDHNASEILEERLICAIESGKAAGGERGGQHSAGLIVVGRDTYPRTDLRVDWYEGGGTDDAVSELRRLFDRYHALIPYYEERPMNPLLPSWRAWLESRSEMRAATTDTGRTL